MWERGFSRAWHTEFPMLKVLVTLVLTVVQKGVRKPHTYLMQDIKQHRITLALTWRCGRGDAEKLMAPE